jgi:preprotein translocase subunit SecA
MDIYKLDVVEIPTNVPVKRIDETTRSIAPPTRRTTPSSS